MGTTHVGWVLSDLVGEKKWYRGNWEAVGELFGGAQFNPNEAYVVGMTPLLRYNFATGVRWVPFVKGGAGVSWTEIGKPDLGSRFEFQLVGGVWTHWFCCDNLAVTFQARFAHLSNAGTARPNNGVKASVFLAGLTWFF